jgi:hypothetical protein
MAKLMQPFGVCGTHTRTLQRVHLHQQLVVFGVTPRDRKPDAIVGQKCRLASQHDGVRKHAGIVERSLTELPCAHDSSQRSPLARLRSHYRQAGRPA